MSNQKQRRKLQLSCVELTKSALWRHMKLVNSCSYDPTVLNQNHFWWKHGIGPAKPSYAVSLFESDHLVGRAMIQRRSLRLGHGHTLRGGLVFDLILAPAHRSAANFISLCRGQMKAPELDILVHTSNEVSDPLYRNLMRYSIVCHLEAYGLPVRSRRILRKLLGRSLPGFDLLTFPWRLTLRVVAEAFRKLSQLEFRTDIPAATELHEVKTYLSSLGSPHFDRDPNFLRWRFLEGPLLKGQLVCLYKANQFCGYVASRRVGFEGIELLLLMDFAPARSLTRTERLAVRLELLARAVREGADVVLTMMNPYSKVAAEILGFPFIRLPDRFLPHQTPIYVRPLRETDALHGLDSMYITLADIDYF
jgi:hypothetical protein